MCHRYNAKANLRQIADLFDGLRINVDSLPEVDLYPMNNVPIIRRDPDTDEWIIEFRQWGWLPAHWKPSENYPTRKKYQRERFNARSETVHSTWGFKNAFRSQRCVLVGNCFYEPFREGGESKYTVENGLIFFAGLWGHWAGGEETIDSCTMLTTEANPLVAANRKGRLRQPVILTEVDQVSRYCNLEIVERTPLEDLLSPLSEDVMTIHEPE